MRRATFSGACTWGICPTRGKSTSSELAMPLSDPLPAKAQEVLAPTPTLLVYRVGRVALVGSDQDFEADALRRQ